MRQDGRLASELRTVRITPGFLKFAQGSCLMEAGDTKVICTATVEDRVPPFLKNQGTGWITAEYSMLPGATPTRTFREVSRGKPGGRTVEIQRLIGRSLRAAMDLKALGEKTVWVDCDVIQADGGTRTASITGGFVALVLALDAIKAGEGWKTLPVADYVAAISVGIHQGDLVLDLPYAEDSTADVDMNVVMTGKGRFVEVQGTGEHDTFDKAGLDSMLDLAGLGIRRLMEYQKNALGDAANLIKSLPKDAHDGEK